jgi:tetratricopeptide (TPR) repeat protein
MGSERKRYDAMTSAAKKSTRWAFLLALSLQAQPVPVENPVDIANDEAVRRQEATVQMHMELERARDAVKKNHLQEAAAFYQQAVARIPNVQVGSPTVELEKQDALAGLDAVREKLARLALAAGDVLEAKNQVDSALKYDPNNEGLQLLRAEIRQREVEQLGRVPSPEVIKRGPSLEKEKIDIATRVQNAKFLYEMGKYDEAEVILVQVVKNDPSNRSAPYYLDLIKEARYMDRARRRESGAKSSIGDVEADWIDNRKRDSLPVPNPMWDTNLVYTTKGRQQIKSKLDAINLNEVTYDLQLKDVLVKLRKESQARDPDGVGINFMINNNVESTPLVDTSGAAVPPAVGSQQQDIGGDVTIRITPALSNLKLSEVLEAIIMVADKPIRYTIQDFGVVFSPKPPDQFQQLQTKTFRVDPNTFVQGLENVVSIQLNVPITSSGATGLSGGGGGGGTGGGGTGGGGTGGGAGSGGGTIPQVIIAPVSQGGGQGGGAGGGGAVGGNGQQRVGLNYVTKTNSTLEAHQLVRAYFTAAGVDLLPPKQVFFNDRLGVLLVRATSADLEIIQQAIEMLNQTPPQVSVEAKFVDLSQEDTKGLGFQWYLGNTLLNNGAIGLQGGTAPSFQGAGTTAPIPAASSQAQAPSRLGAALLLLDRAHNRHLRRITN